ncbi:hypothetical protein EHW67_19565 [Arenibacter aquaticus]|uniref:Fibronectin type-III domain-containing protein n=1 Tax=Arenibacter aquaticus TaxID=2489054 RepID=A0A3S0AKP5_9FLAO|nr:hypothetical protein [Arenibacter aquaticus]RTE52377.1 hypothetical protein EHW67_19565 [Arenibacter aquaticus]
MIRSIILLLLIFPIISCSKGGDTPKEEELSLPAAASLIFPSNNSECIEGVVKNDTQSSVTFQWEDATNADSYELKLKNLSTGVTTGYNVIQNEVTIELDRGSAYSWYVISKSKNSKEISESAVWRFYNANATISSYAPFPALLVSPTINQEIVFSSEGIVLEWTGSDVDKDIVAYDIYFGFSNPPELYQENLNTPKVENVVVKPATNYYWKIITKDSKGNISYSNLFQFKVK